MLLKVAPVPVFICFSSAQLGNLTSVSSLHIRRSSGYLKPLKHSSSKDTLITGGREMV